VSPRKRARPKSPRPPRVGRGGFLAALQVVQFVAVVRGARGNRFVVFRTGDDAFYLFSRLDPSGLYCTGLSFPVRKAELHDDVRRALANGRGNAGV